MAKIYLIDGEKGGVGKSFFCQCLVHYYQQKTIAYELVDTDSNNTDVADIYGGIKDIKFIAQDDATAMYSKQAGAVDKIFEMARNKDVIVNLPAKVHEQVKYWINTSGLLEEQVIKETGVTFCKWFLSNGSYKSIKLLKDSLEAYQGKMEHILVRNKGINMDWSNFEKNKDYKAIKKDYPFKEIDFPALRAEDRDFIEERKSPFIKVAEELGYIPKQRLHIFLKNTLEQIELSQEFARYSQGK